MKLKRLFCLFFDVLIVSFILLPLFWIIGFLFGKYNEMQYRHLLNIIFLVSIICKDLVLQNGSLGKKLFKLKLLTIDDNSPTNAVRVLRNITIFIWPVEVVLIVFFNKRLGDIVFKTKVVED